MSDLLYASIVIVIIWAGIFLWVLKLDRRLRYLENALSGKSQPASEPVVEPVTEPAFQPVDSDQETETTADQS